MFKSKFFMARLFGGNGKKMKGLEEGSRPFGSYQPWGRLTHLKSYKFRLVLRKGTCPVLGALRTF